MEMYGVAVFPPIELFVDQNITEKWLADDGNVSGTLQFSNVALLWLTT